MFQIADLIEIACLLEATAPKLGNVFPGASYHDACYQDFVLAAKSVALPLSQSRELGLGQSVLHAVRATQESVGTNVNLGIILLLAPLAAVPVEVPLSEGITHVLKHTTLRDAEHVYEAIRLAKPGGLGQSNSQDVQAAPTMTLTDAMRLAADRDMVAEQYATGFSYVLNSCQSWLLASVHEFRELTPGHRTLAAICSLQRRILSQRHDSLIVRKCGLAEADAVRKRFHDLESVQMTPAGLLPPWSEETIRLDDWLRSDQHRRNPGATADLIAATLFVALREHKLVAPTKEEIAEWANSLASQERGNYPIS